MQTVSMLEFRRHGRDIVRRVQAGQRLTLTYRGTPVARLEPPEENIAEDDGFYHLAEKATRQGRHLSNQEIDEALYGE